MKEPEQFEKLGFRPVNVKSEIFIRAERVLLNELSGSELVSEHGFAQEKILENDSSYYFPVTWIGCTGYLVLKANFKVICFGSFVDAGVHAWAFFKGVSMEELGKDRKNTFAVTSISNEEETKNVLKSFLNPRFINSEIVPKFKKLPIILEDVDLYFGIRDLRNASENGWFTFEIS